jgi:hypothetical protein
MARKPELPKPASWNIYKVASKAVRLGEVEAPDESIAIKKAAAGKSVRTRLALRELGPWT